ncbi:hypothetical protein [Achromobacter sp.]|uniref:hypothetical protein n=1 Tax=Achromobacter sp. TaxID=134375 RepID=UPI000EDB7B4C|nr:hypothetical protein [Achromobacter sp.]HCW17728.1 hypothetical protein [Achromobacter sp.]
MATAEKTIEERLTELEVFAAAVSQIAVMGAAAAIGDGLSKLLREVADEAPGMPEQVRMMLRAIADSAEGGGSSGDVHS